MNLVTIKGTNNKTIPRMTNITGIRLTKPEDWDVLLVNNGVGVTMSSIPKIGALGSSVGSGS